MKSLKTAPLLTLTTVLALAAPAVLAQAEPAGSSGKDKLNVLFIGNSYTARHNLAKVVKAMAEAGNPGLEFDVYTVIYGGRRLVDHWRFGTANFVRLATLTAEEEKATIASLEQMLATDPKDRHAKGALGRHRQLLRSLESQRRTWDIVVLQSYRDDLQGDPTLYAQYAPRFAELIKAQGARVVLYETTPTTQNAKPLTAAPDPAPVRAKAKAIAKLANQVDALAVPMSLVALRCQTERPDLTLRFINDAHLNQTLAYLTACTFYAALFDKSPQGLPIDSVTDIRFFDNKDKTKDRDGNPITRTFSPKDRNDLQRIAWEGLAEFNKIRSQVGED